MAAAPSITAPRAHTGQMRPPKRRSKLVAGLSPGERSRRLRRLALASRYQPLSPVGRCDGIPLTITNASSPFRSPASDDLKMLPHVATAGRNALRAPLGNATEKIQRSF
jgi:hypothetical protein